MPDPIQITYPKKHEKYEWDRPINKDKVWFASGISTYSNMLVRGRIFLQGTTTEKFQDTITTIHYSRVKRIPGLGSDPIYRWLLFCKCRLSTPEIEQYTLQVEATNMPGIKPAREDLTVRTYPVAADAAQKAGATPKVRARRWYGIGIWSHSDDQNITLEKDSFIAFGEVVQSHSLTIARMVGTNATINPIYTQTDMQEGYWMAQWGSLPPDTYTLYVQDSAGSTHNDEVTGLVVDPPPP